MVAMWQRMNQWFGGLWESAYGSVDDQTISAWTGALERFSEPDLAGAIRSCEDWKGKYPPTFPEFKALVLAARSTADVNFTDKRLAQEKAAGKPQSMIEHLSRVATSPIAKRELAKMKRIMNGELNV
jgi:hypothetical protein